MDCVEIYLSGKTLKETASIVGKATSTVRYHVLRAGKLRTLKEALAISVSLGRFSRHEKRKPHSEQTKKKISLAHKGKGKGVSLKPSGYLEYTMGENKFRAVHLVVMEGIIGRRLYSNETVHHIDHNKTNNDPSNLLLMTKKEHASLHARENYSRRKRTKEGRFTHGKLE